MFVELEVPTPKLGHYHIFGARHLGKCNNSLIVRLHDPLILVVPIVMVPDNYYVLMLLQTNSTEMFLLLMLYKIPNELGSYPST